MKLIFPCTLFLCMLSHYAVTAAPGKLIVKNVNVIPVEASRPEVLYQQDVWIVDGVIKEIRPASKKHNKAYRVIDGTGKYLMPGMADMHAHLPGEESTIQSAEYHLFNLLNGVTVLRQMRGKPTDLAVRDSIQKGWLRGCHMYISTPPFFYWDKQLPILSFRDSFIKFRAQGYDFIKFMGGLNDNQFDSLAAIAASLKIKLTGHVHRNDLEKAIAVSQHSIEHIPPFVSLYQKDSIKFWKVIDNTVTKGLFSCPDIRFYIKDCRQTPMEQRRQIKGREYARKEMLDAEEKDFEAYISGAYNKNPFNFAKGVMHDSTLVAVYTQLLPRLHQRGVKLLVSPAAGSFFVPGFSFIEEMELFVTAGIQPYEAIKCATFNAAECLGEANKWGSVTKNKRADLVLLAGNPLADIKNLEKVEAIILNGEFLTREDLLHELKTCQQAVTAYNPEFSIPAAKALSLEDSMKVKRYVDSAFYQPLYAHKRDLYLDSALAIKPSYAYLWQQKSNPTVKQRKYELAIMYLDSAVKYNPKKYLDYRGFTKCIFQKNYRAALEDFQAAIKLNGNSLVMDHSYDFFMGLCYLQLNKFDSSRYFISRSIDKKVRQLGAAWVHPVEWFYMGIVHFEMENYAKAIESFDSCLVIYKHFPDPKYYKAACLKKTNDLQAALALLVEAGNDMDKGYTFNEDSAPYERFPYQVDRAWIKREVEWLQRQNAQLPGKQ